MTPEQVPAELIDRAMHGAKPGCRSDAAFYLANVLPTVERMIRDDIAARVKHPMDPKDVPGSLVDLGVQIFEDQTHENCGSEDGSCPGNTRPYHEALIRDALAAILPEYEQMVRVLVAKENEES